MQDNRPVITGLVDSGPQFLRTGASIDDKYITLNSGKLVPRYKDFVPGTDNDSRLSAEQSKAERIGHGLAKFGGRTLTTMAGTLGSLLPGPEINDWLDDMNTYMDVYLPNYKDEREREMGFWKSLATMNIDFLADEVGQGASMVAGIVATEALIGATTGGTSLTSVGQRLSAQFGKLGKTASKTTKALKGNKKIDFGDVAKEILNSKVDAKTIERLYRAPQKLSKLQKINQAVRPLLYTHYEADLEAYHTVKEITDNYLDKVKSGEIEYSPEDLMGVVGTAENAAKHVYWGNVPLVGVSNFVVLGGLLGWRGAAEGATKLALDETKGAFRVAKEYTKAQKAARKAWSVWKPMMTEGFIEEGGQGVMSEAAIAYTLAKYDPETNREGISLLEALKEGFHETYFTKEGFMEVGVGMLIGSIGHQAGLARQYRGGAKNFFATEFGLEQAFLKESADALNVQLDKVRQNMMSGGQMRLVERFNSFNTISSMAKKSAEASEKGLHAQASMYNNISQFEFHGLMRNMGMETAMVETLEAQVDAITLEDLKNNGISEDRAAEFKETLKAEIQNQFKRNKFALDTVDAIQPERKLNKKDRENLQKVGLDDYDIRNIMALEISTGINAMENIDTTLRELQELTGIENLGEALRMQTGAIRNRGDSLYRLQELKKRKTELLDKQRALTQVTTNLEVRDETIDAETLRQEAEKVAPELQAVIDELVEVEKEIENLANIEATVNKRDLSIWKNFPPTHAAEYAELFSFTDEMLTPAETMERAQEAIASLEELLSGLQREASNPKLPETERAYIQNTIDTIQASLRDYTYNTSTLKTMLENFALRNSPEYAYKSYKKATSEKMTKSLQISETTFIDPLMRESYNSLEDYIEANKDELTEADKYKLRATHRMIMSVTRNELIYKGTSSVVDPVGEIAYAEYLLTGDYRPFLEEIIEAIIGETGLSVRQENIYAENKKEIDAEVKLERARRGDTMDKAPRPEDIQMDNRLSFKERLLDYINRLKQTVTTFNRLLPNDFDTSMIPTQEDYIEYESILNRERQLLKDQADLNEHFDDVDVSSELNNIEAELAELQERKEALKERLDNWGIVTGISTETGLSISDLLEIALAIQDSRPSPFDTSVLIQLDELTSEIEWNTRKDERYYEIGQVYDNAVVSKTTNNAGDPAITLHNISLAAFIRQIGGVTTVIDNATKTELTDENQIKEAVQKGGKTFSIAYETAEGETHLLSVEIDKLGNLQIDADFLQNKSIGNFLIQPIASYTRNYQPLLIRQADGIIRPVKSDFTFNRGTKTTNPNVVNRVKEGDVLRMVVPLQDEYNLAMIEKYQKATTDKQRVAALEELNNSMIIFLVDGKGELVQVLKGTSTYTGAAANDAGARMRALRTTLVNETLAYLRENPTGEEYNTGKAVEVKQVFRGFPNIEVVQNEDGEFESSYTGVSPKAAKTIVDVGYMENGKMHTRNGSKSIVSHPYMTPYTKTAKYSGKKIPFVVTEQDGVLIAYPVKLKAETIDAIDLLDEALSKENLVEKAIAVNNLIVESGLPIDEHGVTSESLMDDTVVEDLYTTFENLTLLPEVETWLAEETNYDGIIRNDILINVDLANNPFSASKLHVDINKLVPPVTTGEGKGGSPRNSNVVTELINRLELDGSLEIICD